MDAGVSAQRIDERAEDVREACCEAYARLCPRDLSHTVLAGIPGLLDWVAGQSGVKLSLLTGNFAPVARLKLGRAGIGHWLPPGRARLAPTARIAPRCRRSPGAAPADRPRTRASARW